MQDRFLQMVRDRLGKRVQRLHKTTMRQFPLFLKVFLKSIEDCPLLSGVRDGLFARVDRSALEHGVEQLFMGGQYFGTTEEQVAAIGYLVLTKYAQDESKYKILAAAKHFDYSTKLVPDFLDRAREVFLAPFSDYLEEHIDDQQAILYFLRRYKHRCEWFHADRLRKLLEADTQKGEKALAFDMYEYLHEQGINFHIEPRSASGIADLVAEQVGDDRVIADAKIFWPEKTKGKPYLISGFHQAYTYARDYNEPCAYLVIFKMCKEDVNFLVPKSEAIFPCLTLNNKTIFFVVVDICEYGAPASKRGPLKSVDISEKELIQSVEPTKAPENS